MGVIRENILLLNIIQYLKILLAKIFIVIIDLKSYN